MSLAFHDPVGFENSLLLRKNDIDRVRRIARDLADLCFEVIDNRLDSHFLKSAVKKWYDDHSNGANPTVIWQHLQKLYSVAVERKEYPDYSHITLLRTFKLYVRLLEEFGSKVDVSRIVDPSAEGYIPPKHDSRWAYQTKDIEKHLPQKQYDWGYVEAGHVYWTADIKLLADSIRRLQANGVLAGLTAKPLAETVQKVVTILSPSDKSLEKTFNNVRKPGVKGLAHDKEAAIRHLTMALSKFSRKKRK